ncbi:metal ABC transporter permease [Dickeya solani]|uniref:Metal ABC transporter permease n=2 Tax=Dickeya solani TaxID=1089444 RepID=A0ABU4EDL0_9GAMM|nr:metal ABC transporter permease [Dickeya solani]ANE76911.1 iron ABC transporter permease [Dickeya solani IPO 2222]AUC44631.1 Manganese ABC transporter, inner membrane permease protein SitD [Dickeya solani RNS 08.23.3.1.A]AUH07678.1 iron ABC transporter permease [Dickeya solani D s0432-1]AUH11704.1 iron ABC transporter permease [Dickeya solani]AYQ47455.1 Manganese transport system membrane protein MntB [Dickeya solani]
MEWLTLLAEPFSFPFMVKAMLAAGVVGMVCAVLSCFMVLKGWSLMGDAVSHAVLPGVVLAWLAGIPLAIGAFASGLFCALATGYVKERCRIKEDTVMGILFSGMFAVGLVLFSRVNTEQHLSHILFGNVLGITRYELQQTLAISLLVLAVVLIKWRDLVLYCFDPTQAQICGLPVKLLHYGLLTLLSLTIVAALQAVGVILVIAMLITPGITGFVLCKRFGAMMLVAVTSATFSSIFGTWLSYFLDGATGPCIVIIQSLIFIIAQCAAKMRKPQQ